MNKVFYNHHREVVPQNVLQAARNALAEEVRERARSKRNGSTKFASHNYYRLKEI